MARSRDEVLLELAREVPGFQSAAEAVDEAAGEVLALSPAELRCLDQVRHGPQTLEELSHRLARSRRACAASLERLELAGYVRRQGGEVERYEITEHAEEWLESLWGPIRDEGVRLFDGYSNETLEQIARFIRSGRELQEAHARRIRALAETPDSELPRARRPRGGLSPAALRRVQVFIQAHLEQPIRLGELAERAGLSPHHFARAFKTTTGRTPHAYVQQARVAKAERLLRETELPVGEIALRTGFSTQSRFTETFRKVTGFTPARYRRGRR